MRKISARSFGDLARVGLSNHTLVLLKLDDHHDDLHQNPDTFTHGKTAATCSISCPSDGVDQAVSAPK